MIPEGVRVVTVRRAVPDVVASLRRAGVVFDEPLMVRAMQRLEHKLDQIERRLPDVLAVRFSDLQEEETCAAVFEHCLGMAHDQAWWAAAAPVNLQVNLDHLGRYYAAHRPQMDRLAKQAKHRIVANMRPQEATPDGVTFQTEPFRTFYQDAEPLFREHLTQTKSNRQTTTRARTCRSCRRSMMPACFMSIQDVVTDACFPIWFPCWGRRWIRPMRC